MITILNRRLSAFISCLLTLLLCAASVTNAQDTTSIPNWVTIAGTIQTKLGCPADWQPDCNATALRYDAEDDVWQGTFELPAGTYEYKAALNGTWDENYGLNAEPGGANIQLVLPEAATVQFFYDHKTHWVTDNINSLIAVAIGTFQSELGCSSDNQPDCLRSWMQDEDGNGIYSFSTTAIPVGDYETRVALNQSPDEIYGSKGQQNGEPITFSVPTDGFRTTIGLSPARKLINVRVIDPTATAEPTIKPTPVGTMVTGLLVTAPGNYQSEIGCSDDLGVDGDWAPDCFLSQMNDPDEDGIYTFVTSSIPAGNYEVKVAIGGSWSENYGANGARDGANIPFKVEVDYAQVTFTFDSSTKLLTIIIDSSIIGGPAQAGAQPIIVLPPAATQPDLVVIPGTIQSVLGCPGDWQPDCQNTALTFDATDGIWQAAFDIPAGQYEYKVAINGTWSENYGGSADPGGPNVPLSLTEATSVKFYYDHSTHWVADSVRNVIAVAPGSFQSELGCSEDWQPDCFRSWLQDPDGDGLYIFTTNSIPAGDYEVKVALNESWATNYGADGVKDGPNIPFTVPEDGTAVAFVYNSSTNVLLVGIGVMPDTGPVAATPDLSTQKAHWVSADTIAWDVADIAEDATFKLYYAADAGMKGTSAGFDKGLSINLTYDPAGISPDILARFPHLDGFAALKIAPEDIEKVRGIVRQQVGVVAFDSAGKALDGTGLQIPGVLDDLFYYDGPLGATFEAGAPTIRVWAPTAQRVRLHLFVDGNPETKSTIYNMDYDRETGVWTVQGDVSWIGQYYLYEVTVYAPSVQRVVKNLVTDPYSVSLAMNSTRSQIIDLNDPALMPNGWTDLVKPPLEAPEDIVIYELHIRDFSIFDETVPAEARGTYKAFTYSESNGMQHLISLAQAGLTHIHLLPSFDIATINENAAERVEPDAALMATYPPDSDQQQALVNAVRDQDGFNWGYDPYHFNVPEGSYSTNPEGPTRIIEFREMVQALNQNGLRVVIDVVYNHTNASGQGDKSVFDKIVPGYYYRLNGRGLVETSTCCQNTATEHRMMEKFMVDSVILWATAYKVDAFRFDLMGHHMKANMENVRSALDGLTIEADGVDGSQIYVYGEGWNFGEVKDNARGVNATQLNMGGVGIGTFNDRLRDAVRGGSPFGDRTFQGFISGLGIAPNGLTGGTEAEQRARLLLFTDQIRIGMAGNLRDYTFINAAGETVTGADVLYNGSPTGYTLDPQEQIVYVSKHDNETLWDILLYKQLPGVTVDDLVRIQNMGNSIVLLSQGVPFFQAGDALLRSKSLDRNSYNSGDWFNRLDFGYSTNNFGVGLPMQGDNGDRWEEMKPILANPDLRVSESQITAAATHFREMLQIRKSSPLFRLRTGEDIQARLSFQNTGPEQTPGVLAMTLADGGPLEDIDPNYDLIVVIVNATPEAQTLVYDSLIGAAMELHPVLANSADAIVKTSAFDSQTGAFSVPARTTAVFVLKQGR